MKIGKNPVSRAMKAAKSAGKKAKKAGAKAAKKAGKSAGLLHPTQLKDGAAGVAKPAQAQLRNVGSSVETAGRTLTPAQANRFFTGVRASAAKAAGVATVETIKFAVFAPLGMATLAEIGLETPFRAARGAFLAALTVDPLNDSPNEAMSTIGRGAYDDVIEGAMNGLDAYLGFETAVMPMVERAGDAVEQEVLTGEVAGNVAANVRGTVAYNAGGATRDGIRMGLMAPVAYLALLDAEFMSPLRAIRGGFEAALTTDPFNDDLGTTLRTIGAGAASAVWEGIANDMRTVEMVQAVVDPIADGAGDSVESTIAGEG